MDITPHISSSALVINGYGENGFIINGNTVIGSQVIFVDKTFEWLHNQSKNLSQSLVDIIDLYPDNIEILLIGTGKKFQPELNNELVLIKSKFNFQIELMSTPAACRTFNVLLAEGRNIAAALLAC